jgi:hypothetical protein
MRPVSGGVNREMSPTRNGADANEVPGGARSGSQVAMCLLVAGYLAIDAGLLSDRREIMRIVSCPRNSLLTENHSQLTATHGAPVNRALERAA